MNFKIQGYSEISLQPRKRADVQRIRVKLCRADYGIEEGVAKEREIWLNVNGTANTIIVA